MFKVLLIFLIFQCSLKLTFCDIPVNHQSTEKELDPLNDFSNNLQAREHEKRTIFGSGISNYGWAKHIGHHPSGFRYVIGYGPVDLKYVPVLRQPIKLFSNIHSHRYKWPSKFSKPFHSIRPSLDHGWKPVQPAAKPVVVRPVLPIVPVVNPIVKPVVPIVKPVVPVKPVIPVTVTDPECKDEWKQKPVFVHPVPPLTPVNVVHFQPAVKPIPPPQLIPFPQPVASVYPVRPIVSVPQLLPAQPVAPTHPVVVPNTWVPSVKPAHPLIPQHQFFEVSKPNLPVLPLGAVFHSPILQQAPLSPGVLLQKPPPIHSNPGPLVEYHGTHNVVPVNGFINFPKLSSIQPQYSPQFLQTHSSSPSPTLIQTADVQRNPVPNYFTQLSSVQQFPQTHQHLPHIHQQLPQIHQQLPQTHQQLPQTHQQLPQVTNFQQLPHQGQQITDEQYQPPLAHGQLPLEGENSGVSQDNNFFSSNNPNYPSQEQNTQYYNQNDVQQEQFQGSNVIQPGQTDVQTPLYLPPHTGFNPQVENFGNLNSQFSPSQEDRYSDFRPSPSLEPPYNNLSYNRREGVEIQQENDVGTSAEEDYTDDTTENLQN